ncbi:MAG TPA: zinc ribbon domain-containing protein [Candidatus Eisenbacteria bacterium]|nr:zinc ribbon domain-containing protein [Candidatus Eisenbacteria bacterium]
MAALRRKIRAPDPSRMMRISGYFLLVGILIGITLGVYALFNPHFFLTFLNISEYEATSFFLAIYLPTLVIIVGVGYVFATRSSLNSPNMRHTSVLTTLIVLCLSLASLSIFNVLAVLGGVIALAAVILAQAQPSFKVLWKREACFFVQTGSMLIVSASTLFLLMLAISKLLQTYSAGVYQFNYSYPLVLIVIAVLSALTFVATPRMGLQGSKVGLCGVLAFAVGAASFVSATQNDYVYSSLAVYQGLFLLGAGVVITLTGALAYFKLSLSGELLPSTLNPSFTYKGRHCPHCGASWADPNQHICLNCRQSLYSEQAVSFCPHCGRLVQKNANNCPHCGADVTSLPVHISVETPREKGLFSRILDSFELTMKEFVMILVLWVLFNFLSYISYVRTEATNFGYTLISHYGVPLEWLEIIAAGTDVQTRNGGYGRVYELLGFGIVWAPLILDLTIYFLLAFFIVYGTVKLRSKR